MNPSGSLAQDRVVSAPVWGARSVLVLSCAVLLVLTGGWDCLGGIRAGFWGKGRLVLVVCGYNGARFDPEGFDFTCFLFLLGSQCKELSLSLVWTLVL